MHAHEMQKKPDEQINEIRRFPNSAVPYYLLRRNAAMVKSWRVTPSSNNVKVVTKMSDPAHKCATKRASTHNGPTMRCGNRRNFER